LTLLFSLLFSAEPDVNYHIQDNLEDFYIKKITEWNSKQNKSTQPELIKQRVLTANKIIKLLKYKYTISPVKLPPKYTNPKMFVDAIKSITIATEHINKLQAQYKTLLQRKEISKEKLKTVEDTQIELSQLLYAFYHLKLLNINSEIDTYKEHIADIRAVLIKNYHLYKVPLEVLQKDVKEYVSSIENREIDIDRLMIKVDSEAIEKDEESKYFPKIKELKVKNNLERKELLLSLLQLSLGYAQLNESTQAYEALKQTKNIVSSIEPSETTIDIRVMETLLNEIFGISKATLGNTVSTINITTDIVKDWFYEPVFETNNTQISPISIIKILIFFIVGISIASFYRSRILTIKKRWPNASLQSVKFLSNFGFYFIVVITIIITINMIGFDLSSLSLIAGALSIGIGFGLQTIVSNLISGIILIFERSIRIGDRIELSDTIKGTVTDIRIRSTTLKTFDNIEVIIPNSSFMQNNVINWTLEDKIKRISIPFGVAYGTNVSDVENAVLGDLEKSDLIYVRNNPEYIPELRMTAMNSSSVDFILVLWIDYSTKDTMHFNHHFMRMIYNSLYTHKIEIPFPQLDLHMK